MRKVCVVVTARPSYSRIKTALSAIQDHPELELQLVVGSSAVLERYGNAANVMRSDGFPIAAEVFNVLEGETPTAMAKTAGLAIIELSSALDRLQPDIVVTIADRFETIANAIAASYMNIPVAHVQGGEVSGSIDEKVRHSITKLSDLHFVATQGAYDRVTRMGEPAHTVFNTGCPSVDLARHVADQPELDFDPFERYGGVGEHLDLSEGYLVVMQHPVTTQHQHARDQAMATLEAVADLAMPTLWFWPNVDAGSDGTSNALRSFRENNDASFIHFFKNMEPHDFLRVLVNANALVGNSSVGIRESAFLGVPVVNIGSRQRDRERAENVIDVDHDSGEIFAAVSKQIHHGRYETNTLYGDGFSGQRIAELLATEDPTIEKRLSY